MNEEDWIDYSTRAVAFIDILGWAVAVEASKNDAALRARLHNAAWALGAMTSHDANDETPDFPSFDEASQFSDSVIISIPYKRPYDLARLIRQVAQYQQSMFISGFPVRGGITIGPMFHKGSIAFGPALNTAYELENSHSIWPRVIIDKKLRRRVKSQAKKFPKHWPFALESEDGFLFPDYLTTLAMSDSTSVRIDKFIDSQIQNHRQNAGIYSKYEWLKDKWEEAKKDSAWRKKVSSELKNNFLSC